MNMPKTRGAKALVSMPDLGNRTCQGKPRSQRPRGLGAAARTGLATSARRLSASIRMPTEPSSST